jgi:hypothetical protein
MYVTSGSEVIILTIFLDETFGEKMAFFAQTTDSFCKILIIT